MAALHYWWGHQYRLYVWFLPRAKYATRLPDSVFYCLRDGRYFFILVQCRSRISRSFVMERSFLLPNRLCHSVRGFSIIAWWLGGDRWLQYGARPLGGDCDNGAGNLCHEPNCVEQSELQKSLMAEGYMKKVGKNHKMYQFFRRKNVDDIDTNCLFVSELFKY